MRTEQEMIESGLNNLGPTPKKTEIKNLELLHYYAYKLNEIFYFHRHDIVRSDKESILFSAERWKMLRNISIFFLYMSILFIKPGWCENLHKNIKPDCSETNGEEGGTTKYFTVFAFEYFNIFLFETFSWVLILILIIYDMLLSEIDGKMIIIYTFLFLADVITGIFFKTGIMTNKINLLFRTCFVAIYTKYTRVVLNTFLLFIIRARKLIGLYLFTVLYLGLLLHVLFFGGLIRQ